MELLMLLFNATTATFDLPPSLLQAVCYVESKHNVTAVNKNDGGTPSHGVCQVKYATAKSLGFKGKSKDLMIPAVNIYYAGKLLAYQLDKCGTVDRAILAYSSGRCGVGNKQYLASVKRGLNGRN